ncbi:MAG: HAMP domain-containing protein [Betaproteobacteria bacterium]|nr:HAMP domain-containing protein [Betaproteobacteria bacterium]
MAAQLAAKPTPRTIHFGSKLFGFIEFFRYHGVWAPGVRLFRALSFREKAGIITACMFVPMLVLAIDAWRTYTATIVGLQKERAGVEALHAVIPVMQGVLEARNAMRATLGGYPAQADYQQARAATDKALGELRAQLEQDGDPLALKPLLEKLNTAWLATGNANTSANVNATGRTAFGPVNQIVVELLGKLGDNSGLALDSEIDTFYMVNALVLSMPETIEDLAQIWGWASYAAAKGPLTGKELKQYVIWSGHVDSGIKQARGHLLRAIEANPALREKTNFDLFDKALAFRQKADEAAEVGQGDAKGIFVSGHDALLAATSLYGALLPVLDGLLADREQSARRDRLLRIALVALTISLVAYLFYAFYLVMNAGLLEVKKHLRAVADGNLTTAPTARGRDEISDLLKTLAIMQASLRKIVTQVRMASESIVQASTEISSAAEDLSFRSAQTLGGLEESVGSIHKVSIAVSNTADSARQAAQLATDNTHVAERGGNVIGQVVNTMQGINSSAIKIRKIIGTIDSIAFQTNILALNAAVEAARAGEQGRGFAAVATEVRNLAQRSAAASKEINELISISVEQVTAGSAIVKGAGETMTEIVDSAKLMGDLLGEISAATSEQSAGVMLVSTSVQQLDRMTQQNSALVEETTATAANLKEQALMLAAEVASFKLPL